ncbi:NADH dehydrogenase [ubiquinone] 1 beta subcomplex subunit 10 [Nasonia vitripennis]|uniref:NADH dehydrogenase [ubiquinone] 1 beta subcomplex subunit 10 n=1 Tax=Nasonia vitripennis TaxID=7425 RepID=A0A7M6UDI7_NASVI|nr:NADH dehydrogenase [ubiquinone] 1 beta subcomplex subunit 10 [Nasonia vitripennis]
MEEPQARNPINRLMWKIYNVLDVPVTFFREKIVEPNQKSYPYYHQKYRRVPTIDTCYTDDYVCRYEANQQFLRDRQVDSQILSILRDRHDHCVHEDYNQREEAKCKDIYEVYEENAANWFCKYGDLGPMPDVVHAFMKQKHRMIWERRHGPIGSGMKEDPYKIKEDD